jgi:hypothetical protein
MIKKGAAVGFILRHLDTLAGQDSFGFDSTGASNAFFLSREEKQALDPNTERLGQVAEAEADEMNAACRQSHGASRSFATGVVGAQEMLLT